MIDDPFDPVDPAFLRLIMNRCIAIALDGIIEIPDPDQDVKNIEYCPVWTLGADGKKTLLKIRVRTIGSQTFSEIDSSSVTPGGLTINELLEYFSRSDATKAVIN